MDIYKGLSIQLFLKKHSPTSLVRGTQTLQGTIVKVDEEEQTVEISVQMLGMNTLIVVYGWELENLKLIPANASPMTNILHGNNPSSSFILSIPQQQQPPPTTSSTVPFQITQRQDDYDLPAPPVLPTPNPTPYVGTPQQAKSTTSGGTTPSKVSGKSQKKIKKRPQQQQQQREWIEFDKQKEFDFEKNLNLFDKQKIFAQIQSQINDVVDVDTDN